MVRLKGGDPYLFGRGAEEADALTAAAIAWEMVPAVTSAFAVPVYAGIAVTDAVLLIGHGSRDERGVREYEALARSVERDIARGVDSGLGRGLKWAGEPGADLRAKCAGQSSAAIWNCAARTSRSAWPSATASACAVFSGFLCFCWPVGT